jgi:hypothetical protein
MRHRACVILILAALVLAPAASAQKKQKDPVLQAYLEQTFADLSAKLLKLSDRLTAIEEEIGRIKQQQAAAAEEARSTQTILRNTDSSLSSFRMTTQQEIIAIKQDLAKIRQDVAQVLEAPKTAAPAPGAGETSTKIEGYITAVTGSEVTINLGSSTGMRVGTKLTVFRATDPKTQIGLIEVVEVLDANNSRAKIVFTKPDAKFDFSDIVRPE